MLRAKVIESYLPEAKVVTNGTDSYIMHTWYVGQAWLFPYLVI